MENKSSHSFLKRFLFALKLIEIRLRFILLLVITALVVGYWDNIQNHYERWQRDKAGQTVSQPGSEASESEEEYYCPMHTYVVRNAPGKCPICGMDLSKRKKGEAVALPDGVLSRVQVSPDRVMQAGVQMETVAYRLLSRTIRTYGIVEPDETRTAKIVARFPGRIENLLVNAVGLTVKKGEPLAQIYSAKYLAAAQEYAQTLKSQNEEDKASPEEKERAAHLAASARQRLALAGFTEEQLNDIQQKNQASETVTLYSPLEGTVLEKNALLGETVEEGTVLYTIADLSKVWVQVLTLESDIFAVKLNMPVEITCVSWPGEILYGTVDFIQPTVNPENRSVKVRVVVDNAKGKLKPGMYATAVIRAPLGKYGDADSLRVASASVPTTANSAASVPTTANSVASGPPPQLPTDNQEDADRFLASLKVGAEYFVCSMHPEVVSDKAGDCPKCGMVLVSAKKAALKESNKDLSIASGPPPNLPTEDQGDADRFLATLKVGAEYFVCSMHPEVVSDKAGDCPKCGMVLVSAKKPASVESKPGVSFAERPSDERWADGYACEMHIDELSDTPGVCRTCGCGMKMKHIKVERVLSIPETAVVDTGMRQVVYIQSVPGVFDSRAVTLGPRAGAFYQVLDGLSLGDQVVARGAFLIDAEARLNPAAAGATKSASGEGG